MSSEFLAKIQQNIGESTENFKRKINDFMIEFLLSNSENFDEISENVNKFTDLRVLTLEFIRLKQIKFFLTNSAF